MVEHIVKALEDRFGQGRIVPVPGTDDQILAFNIMHPNGMRRAKRWDGEPRAFPIATIVFGGYLDSRPDSKWLAHSYGPMGESAEEHIMELARETGAKVEVLGRQTYAPFHADWNYVIQGRQ